MDFADQRSTVELDRGQATALVLAGYERFGMVSMGRWKRRMPAVALILSDVLLATLVWAMASVLQGVWGNGPLSDVSTATVVPVAIVWVALRALLGLYPGNGLDSVEELRRHVYGTFAALSVLAIFAAGFQVADELSRLLLVLTFLGLLLIAPFVRQLTRLAVKCLGLWGKPVVIFRYKETGTDTVDLLRRNWDLGYHPVAVFEYNLGTRKPRSDERDGHEILAEAASVVRRAGLDTAILAMPHTRREQLAELVSFTSLSFRHVLIIPNLVGITNSAVVARDLGGVCALELEYNLLNPWALRLKRMADLAITVVGGILLMPILSVLALLVYLESGGPVIYRDLRMGKEGKLFSCLKFRTMVSDAEALLHKMLAENPEIRKEYLKYHKLRDDPRVTRVGRFLRKTSLDELPQIWNVLRGEMSLVGPRPYLPRESEEIGLTQGEILRVPPGITGPWQVSGRNHTSFGDRVQMDTYYVRDWSIWLDVVLFARTAKTLLFDRGAY